MKNRYCILVVLLFSSSVLFAQRDLTIHFLNKINQSNYSNPAFIPENNFSIGLPFISAISGDFSNSGFKLRDVLERGSDDSIHLSSNLKNLINNVLEPRNYLTADLSTDLLAAKFKIKGLYFGINVTEHFSFHLDYPQDFAKLFLLGNGAFVDSKTDAEIGVKMNNMHYREYGLSGALKVKKFTFGARLKLLTGFSDISTEKSDISIHTDPNDYSITTKADVLINTTMPEGITIDPDSGFKVAGFSPSKYAFNFKNKGFGADLGATFELNSKITFNASIVDLGFIKWTSNVSNYQSSVNPAPFSGVPISAFSNGTAFVDTLKKRFGMVQTHNTYTTTLTPKVYLSGTFKITDKDKVGVLIYSEYYNRTHTGGLTYSIFNNNFINIGLGTGFKMGPVQIYTVQDNILGFILPKSSNNINFRFGMNLVFGKPAVKSTVPHPPPVSAD
jgi:hypothetical protein